MSMNRLTAITAAAVPVEPGILRDRFDTRFRARLYLSVRPRRRFDPGSDRQRQCRRLPWGEDHHATYRKLVNRRIGVSVICEDLPEEHNRVTLDPELKDSHGFLRRKSIIPSAPTATG